MSKLISLRQWADDTYGSAQPCLHTLRRWAREGKIQPPAQKHGREYFVQPDAQYRAYGAPTLKDRIRGSTPKKCA